MLAPGLGSWICPFVSSSSIVSRSVSPPSVRSISSESSSGLKADVTDVPPTEIA